MQRPFSSCKSQRGECLAKLASHLFSTVLVAMASMLIVEFSQQQVKLLGPPEPLFLVRGQCAPVLQRAHGSANENPHKSRILL